MQGSQILISTNIVSSTRYGRRYLREAQASTWEDIQGDRIFIPSIDVDERLEGDRIVGPWVVDQGSTLLLWLEIEDAITLGGYPSALLNCNGLQLKWVRTAINGNLGPDYLHLSIPSGQDSVPLRLQSSP